VLIGAPGAGKTTAIQRLVLDTARTRLADAQHSALPLLLYLPSWAADQVTPDDFVRAARQSADLPDIDPLPLILNGEVHLFLDGLNEIGAKESERAAQLRDWIERGPRQIVVTCRADENRWCAVHHLWHWSSFRPLNILGNALWQFQPFPEM
jgi:predicted NACHT family NTPase